MAERNTWGYELWKGGKLQYVGITNDPDRRASEHGDKGNLQVETNARIRGSAVKWEEDRLDTYKRNHGGRLPPLNKQG